MVPRSVRIQVVLGVKVKIHVIWANYVVVLKFVTIVAHLIFVRSLLKVNRHSTGLFQTNPDSLTLTLNDKSVRRVRTVNDPGVKHDECALVALLLS